MAIEISVFVANLKRLNPMAEIKKACEKHRFFLSDKTLEQWEQGKDGTGKPLTSKYTGKSTYSESWAKQRRSRGLQVSYFDLRYTGDLADNLRTYVTASGQRVAINIQASTPGTQKKEKDLNAMFGTKIGGVTKEVVDEYSTLVAASLTGQIKEKIFAG